MNRLVVSLTCALGLSCGGQEEGRHARQPVRVPIPFGLELPPDATTPGEVDPPAEEVDPSAEDPGPAEEPGTIHPDLDGSDDDDGGLHPCEGEPSSANGSGNESGSLDTSFGSNGTFEALTTINDVDEQPDGRLVFTGWAGVDRLYVCRLEASGVRDLSFGLADGCGFVDVGQQVGGKKLVIRGDAIFVAGMVSDGVVVARFTPDGLVDPGFGSGGFTVIDFGIYGDVEELLYDDGKLVVAANAGGHGYVLRLTTTGSMDTTFATGGKLTLPGVGDVLSRGSGRLVAIASPGLRAFKANGTPDHSFGDGNGIATLPFFAYALTRTESGLLAATNQMSVMRLTWWGEVESVEGETTLGSYDPDGGLVNGTPRTIRELSNGKIVMGGAMQNGTSDGTAGIGRRRANGNPDDQFGTEGAQHYWGMTYGLDLDVSCDGSYLLAGSREYAAGNIKRVWN